jgi:hypothetical protein
MQLFTEAKVLEALIHPNIVCLKESYKTESQKLVLILEQAEGGDLKAKIDIQKGEYFTEEIVTSNLISLDFATMSRTKILPRSQSTASRSQNVKCVLESRRPGEARRLWHGQKPALH